MSRQTVILRKYLDSRGARVKFILVHLPDRYMDLTLTLYGTEGCHLCEDAQAVLAQAGLQWHDIDIAEDDGLLELYQLRIPVLRAGQGELDWPFDRTAVEHFLSSAAK